MSTWLEAVVLPLLFLTVVLLASVRPGAVPLFVPPGLFSLVLAALLAGALVRSGTLAPARLLDHRRSVLANVNGVAVLATGFAAAAQLFTMLMPASGLPLFFTGVLLFVLLLNTWVSLPDRVHLLRSVLVIAAAGFILKFVVLASISDASGGRTKRVLVALFDAATLGAIAQEPQHAAAGYLAFVAIVLFLMGLWALPALPPGAGLVRRRTTTS